MSDPEPFFRPEALDHHAGGGGPGGLLRLRSPWLTWLSRALVVTVAAGGLAAWAIRVDERASGQARLAADGKTFVALLPAAVSDAVEPGDRLRLRFPRGGGGVSRDGGGELAARAQAVETVGRAEARRAGFEPDDSSHLLVRGALERPVAAGGGPLSGRADIVLGSPRLLSVFLG